MLSTQMAMESYLWMTLLSIIIFLAMGLTREESKKSFDTIDADKNGEISYEEFMNAVEDFYRGTEETELSKAFFGPLVD